MRCRLIVLLAVCSNVAVAGILRYNGARTQHLYAPRFLNHTEILSTPADSQTSTTIATSSLSLTPLIAASPEVSFSSTDSSTAPTATPLTPNAASSSSTATDLPTTSASSQGLLMSATLSTTLATETGSETSDAGTEITPTSAGATVVQPAETASRLFQVAGSPSKDLQPSTDAQSLKSTSSPNSSGSLSATSEISSATSIRAAATTASSSSAVTHILPLFEDSFNASPTTSTSQLMPYTTTSVPTLFIDTASQTPSTVVIPVPISSGLVQISATSGGAADEFAPVTLNPSSPAPTGTVKYPTAENGNSAMAADFNSIYKTLNTDTPCNPSDPSQAYVCIDGETAECQSDGTYVLKSCPLLQSCYALPKGSGLTGVVVQCAVPSDAQSILAGLSSSTAVPVTVTSQPAQALQAEGGLSQVTPSVNMQSPVQTVTSSPSARANIQSQTMAPTTTVLAVSVTPPQNQDSDSVDNTIVSTETSSTSAHSAIQSPSSSSDSPVIAVTATPQQVQDSGPSVTDSSISSTSASVSPTEAPVQTIPDALFAVVTADESGQASSSENSRQSPLPTSSPQVDPDSPRVSEASITSTSTSSANDADITFAPTGISVNQKVAVGNGQATVTVTVTVTTTERPAPVTIVAS